MAKLSAPFPWFGGKSKVAAAVWEALGDVDLYIEPFAGSLAVLLNRPDYHVNRFRKRLWFSPHCLLACARYVV